MQPEVQPCPNCSKGRRLDGERVQADVYEIPGPGGKRVSRDTPGARKVREKATKWYGQYTDVDDKLTKTPLSPDKVAARQMLANLVREAERGKAGLTDPRAEQKQAPIESQVKLVFYTTIVSL